MRFGDRVERMPSDCMLTSGSFRTEHYADIAAGRQTELPRPMRWWSDCGAPPCVGGGLRAWYQTQLSTKSLVTWVAISGAGG